MYLRSEEVVRQFKTVSKLGKEFYRPRKKIVHTFQCDSCGQLFSRDRHEINSKRACNDYKHFCEKCYDHAMIADLGRDTYRNNLRQRVGEKWVDSCGYINVYMGPDYKGSGYCGSVREHILVMEQHIGRGVVKGEVVHHIDGDKTNNDINNLQLMSVEEHNKCHATSEAVVFEMYKKGLVGYDRKSKRYFTKELEGVSIQSRQNSNHITNTTDHD